MLSQCYLKVICLMCKKNQKSVNPKVLKTSNVKTVLLSKCAICGTIKSRFMKQQEAKGLKSLGLKTPLNKIPLLKFHYSIFCFECYQITTK